MMGRLSAWSVLYTFLFVFIVQVFGQPCADTDNVYCDNDQYCCGSTCCNVNSDYYSYGFWNIWYFWFIVFFILMTCCGGCGFYRRRQAYMNQNGGTFINSTTIVPPPRGGGINVLAGTYPTQPVPTAPQGYYQGPPTYNEAVTKPYMYPKTEPFYPPPPMVPVNGATPNPQPNPGYPSDPAYPAYPTNPAAYPVSPPAYPVSPPATSMPAPPPYSTTDSAPQPTAPAQPTAS